MWRHRFTTALLILFWLLTPDLLCLMPGMAMTADEHKCCEQMGSDCGKVPMQDMTCCRPAPHSDVAIVARTADYSEIRAAILPAIPHDMDSLYGGDAHSGHWLRFESPTAPLLISRDSFDILRI